MNFTAFEVQLAARKRGLDEPFFFRGAEGRLEFGQREVKLSLLPVHHAPVQASRKEVGVQLDGSVEILLCIPIPFLLGEREAADAVSPRSIGPEGHAGAERFHSLGKPRQAQVTAAQLEVRPVVLRVDRQGQPVLVDGLRHPIGVGLPRFPFQCFPRPGSRFFPVGLAEEEMIKRR